LIGRGFLFGNKLSLTDAEERRRGAIN